MKELTDDTVPTAAQIQRVKDWWENTMRSRNKDPNKIRYSIVMSRLHRDDLLNGVDGS